jgi:hypothetical protein
MWSRPSTTIVSTTQASTYLSFSTAFSSEARRSAARSSPSRSAPAPGAHRATAKQIGANLPNADNEWTPAHVVTGDLVYSVSGVGKLWQWDLDATRWAEQACLVANRSLTQAEWELFLPDLEYDPACRD